MQLDIFEVAVAPKVGGKAKVKFHADEIEYVREHCSELLETGEVIEKQLDFCRVRFGELVHVVESRKLVSV